MMDGALAAALGASALKTDVAGPATATARIAAIARLRAPRTETPGVPAMLLSSLKARTSLEPLSSAGQPGARPTTTSLVCRHNSTDLCRTSGSRI